MHLSIDSHSFVRDETAKFRTQSDEMSDTGDTSNSSNFEDGKSRLAQGKENSLLSSSTKRIESSLEKKSECDSDDDEIQLWSSANIFGEVANSRAEVTLSRQRVMVRLFNHSPLLPPSSYDWSTSNNCCSPPLHLVQSDIHFALGVLMVVSTTRLYVGIFSLFFFCFAHCFLLLSLSPFPFPPSFPHFFSFFNSI